MNGPEYLILPSPPEYAVNKLYHWRFGYSSDGNPVALIVNDLYMDYVYGKAEGLEEIQQLLSC